MGSLVPLLRRSAVRPTASPLMLLPVAAALLAVPLGGRISDPQFAEAWGAVLRRYPSGFTAGVVADGYRVPWCGPRRAGPGSLPLPHTSVRTPRDSRPRLSQEQQLVLDGEISKMTAMDVVEEVSSAEATAPGSAWSSMFSVPKAEPGEHRPVWNGARVNEGVPSQHFRMETLAVVRALIPRNAWFTSIDITKCFQHILVHPESRPLLGFKWGGRLYRFRTVPFGISTGPRTATKVLAPVWAFMRETLGVSISVFIDDALFWHRDRDHLCSATAAAMEILMSLGIEPNLRKSVVVPTRVITHLGMRLDSRKMVVTLPPAKRKSLRAQVRKWAAMAVTPGATCSPRSLAALSGALTAAGEAVPLARLYSARIQRAKTEALHRTSNGTAAWDVSVPVPPEIGPELDFWDNALKAGSPLARSPMRAPPPSVLLETDSSGYQWGAVLRLIPMGYRSTEIPVNRESLPIIGTARGRWSPAERDSAESICSLETSAVAEAIQALAPQLRGERVLVATDSIAARGYLRRQRGRLKHLEQRALRLWEAAIAAGIKHLDARHLRGKFNRHADFQSRTRAPYSQDWRLSRAALARATSRWGPISADLFAAKDNSLHGVYFAAESDPDAAGQDAFLHPWGDSPVVGPLPLIHPPIALLPRALAKLRAERARALVVLPVWRGRPWWSLAETMMIASMAVGSTEIVPGPDMPASRLTRPRTWETVLALMQG